MFIRVKKIGGKEYAYLVENRWRRRGTKNGQKGARQKVNGYLGRLYSFDKKRDIGFLEYHSIDDMRHYINNNDKVKVIRDLIDWEISRHEVKDIHVNFDEKEIRKGRKIR